MAKHEYKLPLEDTPHFVPAAAHFLSIYQHHCACLDLIEFSLEELEKTIKFLSSRGIEIPSWLREAHDRKLLSENYDRTGGLAYEDEEISKQQEGK